jgi:nucleoside-diphosphate kinase
VVAIAAEGPNAIAVVRATVGGTRPHEAAPGSIRADFGLTVDRNLVHASDGPETAAQELALWFTADELLAYSRAIDPWILGE